MPNTKPKLREFRINVHQTGCPSELTIDASGLTIAGVVHAKLWKDAKHGRSLFMSERADLEGVLSSPLGRVPKLLPNREVSSEGRIIRDLRQVNVFSPKERHPEVKTPTHQEIARKIVQEKAKWPDIPVLMSKRDIDGAFKRVR